MLIPAFIIYQKSEQHVYEENPVLYILAFGLVAAKVTNRLVVSTVLNLLAKEKYYKFFSLGSTHDEK